MPGSNKLVVVTGATGHLGANLCLLLLEHGYRVRALHRRDSSGRNLRGLDLELRCGDIRDETFMRKALSGADAIVHLAARISIQGDKDGELHRTNVGGTQLVTRLCLSLRIEKMIHISSIHSFDLYHNHGVLDETSSLAKEDAFDYDASKRQGLEKIREAMAQGLNGTILCPVGLLGPRDYEPSLMGHFFINLYKGHLPALVKGGFYWSDVRDTAKAIMSSLEQPARGEVYLLGGHYAEVRRLAALASQVTEKNLSRPVLPYFLAIAGLPFLKLYTAVTARAPLYTYESLKVLRSAPERLNDEKARTELGYSTRPLVDTIRDTYDWHLQQGSLD